MSHIPSLLSLMELSSLCFVDSHNQDPGCTSKSGRTDQQDNNPAKKTPKFHIDSKNSIDVRHIEGIGPQVDDELDIQVLDLSKTHKDELDTGDSLLRKHHIPSPSGSSQVYSAQPSQVLSLSVQQRSTSLNPQSHRQQRRSPMIKAFRPHNFPTPNAVQIGDHGQDGVVKSSILSVSVTNIEDCGALFFMGLHANDLGWIVGVRFALDNKAIMKAGMATASELGRTMVVEVVLPDTPNPCNEYRHELDAMLKDSFPGSKRSFNWYATAAMLQTNRSVVYDFQIGAADWECRGWRYYLQPGQNRFTNA